MPYASKSTGPQAEDIGRETKDEVLDESRPTGSYPETGFEEIGSRVAPGGNASSKPVFLNARRELAMLEGGKGA